MLSSYKSHRIFSPRADLVIANQQKLQVLALSLSTHKDVLLRDCLGFWAKRTLYYWWEGKSTRAGGEEHRIPCEVQPQPAWAFGNPDCHRESFSSTYFRDAPKLHIYLLSQLSQYKSVQSFGQELGILVSPPWWSLIFFWWWASPLHYSGTELWVQCTVALGNIPISRFPWFAGHEQCQMYPG